MTSRNAPKNGAPNRMQYHPAPLPPLRNVDAYTSWPGGVDPTATLYRINNQAGGKKSKKNTCRNAKKNSRRNAKKNSRRNAKKNSR